MSTTAISAVVPRRPTTLEGRVTAVAAFVRPWFRLHVDLCDGTGTITLRFMGRTEIPGVVLRTRMNVEGTPSVEGDTLIMLNPRYTLLGDATPLGHCG